MICEDYWPAPRQKLCQNDVRKVVMLMNYRWVNFFNTPKKYSQMQIWQKFF